MTQIISFFTDVPPSKWMYFTLIINRIWIKWIFILWMYLTILKGKALNAHTHWMPLMII